MQHERASRLGIWQVTTKGNQLDARALENLLYCSFEPVRFESVKTQTIVNISRACSPISSQTMKTYRAHLQQAKRNLVLDATNLLSIYKPSRRSPAHVGYRNRRFRHCQRWGGGRCLVFSPSTLSADLPEKAVHVQHILHHRSTRTTRSTPD